VIIMAMSRYSTQKVSSTGLASATESVQPLIKRGIYPRVVTLFIFSNKEKPWDHCAVRVGRRYVSVYPETHVNPPQRADEDNVTDSSDFSPKLLNLWNGIVRPMFWCGVAFERQEVECQYLGYESVDVPVTEEQYRRVKAFTRSFQQGANDRTARYSIVKQWGTSCAHFGQRVLEHITKGEDDERHAKPTWGEAFVTWPSSMHRRAVTIAARRQQDPSPSSDGHETEALVLARVTTKPGKSSFTEGVATLFSRSRQPIHDRHLEILCVLGSTA